MVWPSPGASLNGTTMKSADCRRSQIERLVVIRQGEVVQRPPAAVADVVYRHLTVPDVGVRQRRLFRAPRPIVRRLQRLEKIRIERQRGKKGLAGTRRFARRRRTATTARQQCKTEPRGPRQHVGPDRRPKQTNLARSRCMGVLGKIRPIQTVPQSNIRKEYRAINENYRFSQGYKTKISAVGAFRAWATSPSHHRLASVDWNWAVEAD